jgi:hypothetical protein
MANKLVLSRETLKKLSLKSNLKAGIPSEGFSEMVCPSEGCPPSPPPNDTTTGPVIIRNTVGG